MQHGLLPIFRVTPGGNHHCGLGSGLLVHPPLPVLLPGSYSRSFGPLAVWPQQEATGFCKAANGTRIIYDLKFLLECKNSPTARRPPCCLPQIPGVTAPPTAPPPKLEELTEQKETEEEIPDDEQFGMDI
ncbi:eukaryotic translation initiation factor 4E-binding protein 3 [Bubalus kerabau]|uniref:eukaryotic translation initiation factor 4E-binding protein 3 n=1 Tax=Bubalus carabanensis TaxID=3119969 RepID=UPI00244E5FC0|nr:eukaryotic translation initiation factor 4E-binding protein 3 [Bubalus carabanensis]